MAAARPKPDNSAAGRLQRLLALVPWLRTHDGTTVVAAAEHFGVSTDQLIEDLNLLIVSGLPGHGPGQLVDIDFFDDEGEITVTDGSPWPISVPTMLPVSESTPPDITTMRPSAVSVTPFRLKLPSAAVTVDQMASSASRMPLALAS